MPTRADVAKMAGVSAATVSNFYNGLIKVNTETQDKILEAAKTLGYPPPPMNGRKSTAINAAFVIQNIRNPHYNEVFEGMNHVAENEGATIGMLVLWKNVDDFCKMLIRRKYTDICLGTSYEDTISDQQIEFLSNNGVKFHRAHRVLVNRETLMIDAVNYLTHMGHSRIAYLCGLAASTNIRLDAFKTAMHKCGLVVDDSLIIDGIFPYDTDAKSGYRAMKNRLDKRVDLTAVIALNDLLAMGAMYAISEKGLRIPDDISVIGNDDIPMAQYTIPPLTTMKVSAFDIGVHSMYSILQSAQGKDLPSIDLQTQLIVRKSTGVARHLEEPIK